MAWDPAINVPFGIGDFSVAFVPDPSGAFVKTGGIWIMMFDQQGAIFFSTALSPWGPWSAPAFVFNKDMGNGTSSTQAGPGGSAFLHGHLPGKQTGDNGIDGPTLPNARPGATTYNVYGPVEKFCSIDTSGPAPAIVVHWTFCGCEPYYAFLMKSTFPRA